MKKPLVVPPPGERVSAALYRDVRQFLAFTDPDYGEMMRWARSLAPPIGPTEFAGEVIWCILCAGKKAQSARTIEGKVRAALDAGRPVVPGDYPRQP